MGEEEVHPGTSSRRLVPTPICLSNQTSVLDALSSKGLDRFWTPFSLSQYERSIGFMHFMTLPKYTCQLDKKTHVFYSFSESDYRYVKDLYRFAIESFTANSLSDKMLQAHRLPHVIFGRAGIQLGNGMGLCTRNRDRIEIKIKQCQRTCIRVKNVLLI